MPDGKGNIPRGHGGANHGRGDFSRTAKIGWRDWRPMFSPLSGFVRHALEILPKILAQVRPLKKSHRESLPNDIRGLSQILTSGRSGLDRPYWSSPSFTSAYLYYFLPWNIIRLARLFESLPLPPMVDKDLPLLADAGSGPLTLPIALWLSRKDWREKPVEVLALDTSRQPLELGLELFTALGDALKLPTWHARIVAGNLESMPRHLARCREAGLNPLLVAAANTLNESASRGRLKSRNRQYEYQEGEEDFSDAEIAPGLCELLEAWSKIMNIDGNMPHMLLVEPGTRLGGTTMMRLRQIALGNGLQAVSPCVHNEKCPLLAKGGGKGGYSSAWCHFVFDVSGAPEWLLNLSRAAGFDRQTLSLSPLLLKAGASPTAKMDKRHLQARVISNAFHVGGSSRKARYACCAAGQCLMPDAEKVPSGARVEGMINGKRDARTNIPFLYPSGK